MEAFKKLKTDTERWVWLMKNKSDAVVYLDNDETYVMIDDEAVYFLESIGDMSGIWSLLDAVGIAADGI